MIVVAKVMIYDRVVCMICFEKVLERPRSSLRCCFDVMDWNGRQINGRIASTVGAEERNLERW